MLFYPLHFGGNVPREFALGGVAVYVGEKIVDILVNVSDRAFGIEKNFCRVVAKFQIVTFMATVRECVDFFAKAKRVKGADENDKRLI